MVVPLEVRWTGPLRRALRDVSSAGKQSADWRKTTIRLGKCKRLGECRKDFVCYTAFRAVEEFQVPPEGGTIHIA
ncbi:MAG TPA: hypothetical protein VKS79_21985 [Gemmataceae bacterium]|nr:hypothetical protein [Gemmataceae bacterium]